jgi:hypothetical protein
MRQKIVFIVSIITTFLFSFISDATPNRHLEELKSNFPYGLLTDDYGILTKNDLAINDCIATPVPFNSRSHSYTYWQCFESKSITIDCDSDGIPDEHEGILGLVVVKACTTSILHDYIERRLWPIKDCKGFVKDAKKILKGTQYACIAGAFIGDKLTTIPDKETISWTFERIKTTKGCEGRVCDFNKEFKQSNCIER